MAGTPKRAAHVEAALTGAPFTEAALEAAASLIGQDFAPLSDVRGTAAYRLTVAANLLRRLWAQSQGEAVSVLELADG
ncbi:hypothetical protein GT370_13030 [Acidocella sp. MX-AZ03]|nr:hypothetical protein [Acidocella sp. MX-AZ03]WBO58160.1 hypothetical protein GT370_13030 [Acidocella sp. MX-AZ03]